MQLATAAIGNSRGIRLPKVLLDKYGFGDAVEAELRDDSLVLKPAKKARDGWEEAFRQMHEQGNDALLLPNFFWRRKRYCTIIEQF